MTSDLMNPAGFCANGFALPSVRVCTVHLARQFPKSLDAEMRRHLSGAFPMLTTFYVLDRLQRLQADNGGQRVTAHALAQWAAVAHHRRPDRIDQVLQLARQDEQVTFEFGAGWSLTGKGLQFVRVGYEARVRLWRLNMTARIDWVCSVIDHDDRLDTDKAIEQFRAQERRPEPPPAVVAESEPAPAAPPKRRQRRGVPDPRRATWFSMPQVSAQ